MDMDMGKGHGHGEKEGITGSPPLTDGVALGVRALSKKYVRLARNDVRNLRGDALEVCRRAHDRMWKARCGQLTFDPQLGLMQAEHGRLDAYCR